MLKDVPRYPRCCLSLLLEAASGWGGDPVVNQGAVVYPHLPWAGLSTGVSDSRHTCVRRQPQARIRVCWGGSMTGGPGIGY